MIDWLLLLLFISIPLNVVAIMRYRDAEAQVRLLKSLIPNNKKDDFEITKHLDLDGRVTKCIVVIHNRRGLPILSDLTGIPLHRLADQFDEDEKKGKNCVIETKEFKI